MKADKRANAVIVALVALSLVMGGAVAMPTALSIRQLKSMIDQAQQDVNQANLLRNQTRDSLSGLNAARDAVQKLSSVAVVEGSELPFVTAMEKAADDADVKQIINLRADDGDDVSHGEKLLHVSIDVRGDFPNLVVFLYKIERLPYHVNFKSLDVRGRQWDAGERSGVNAQIEATIRLFAKDEPAFKVPSHPVGP